MQVFLLLFIIIIIELWLLFILPVPPRHRNNPCSALSASCAENGWRDAKKKWSNNISSTSKGQWYSGFLKLELPQLYSSKDPRSPGKRNGKTLEKCNPLSATEEKMNLVYWSAKEWLDCIRRGGFGKNKNNGISVKSTDKKMWMYFI